ncbi:MAG: cell division protein ZapB, partial [Thermodesulfobacteriota bacterium]|nr:cell division protein ZapB [Thermodesulfobacteriota bacterium]
LVLCQRSLKPAPKVRYVQVRGKRHNRGNKEKMTKEIDNLEKLEEKITQLVEAYASLKNEKIALTEKLAQKEMELKGLMGKVAVLSEERETARVKVENLLNRIDRIISPGKTG